MTSELETEIVKALRPILATLPEQGMIVQTPGFREVLNRLEWYLGRILDEAHPNWDSFDGICSAESRKVGKDEVEIFAEAILITDQTFVPLHVRFQLAENTDEVAWMELRLGELTENGMRRIPYSSPKSLNKLLIKMATENEELANFNWAYHVGFGERPKND